MNQTTMCSNANKVKQGKIQGIAEIYSEIVVCVAWQTVYCLFTMTVPNYYNSRIKRLFFLVYCIIA